MANPKFMNTSEIASALNTNNKRVSRHFEKLGITPCGKIENKPSSHKSGNVYRAKAFRILRRHFLKLAV